MGQPYAEGYTEPLVHGFGANQNTGLYHTARIPAGKLTFDIGVKFMGTYLNENDQTFRRVIENVELNDYLDLQPGEIDAAIAWMKDEQDLAKVGCVGYCMGGGLTLATAIRPTSRVDAVHVYYGGGMPSAEQIATITVPVLGSYGGEDAGIPVEQVDMLRATLR